ncbi:MAG: hypothetical protein ACYC64_10310 [Armatimonadota bacterium]
MTLEVDFDMLESQIEKGAHIAVTYRYPSKWLNADGTRTDRLLAVEPKTQRVFVSFMGKKPVWIEKHEVLNIQTVAA